jgi:hypothetical protein
MYVLPSPPYLPAALSLLFFHYLSAYLGATVSLGSVFLMFLPLQSCGRTLRKHDRKL